MASGTSRARQARQGHASSGKASVPRHHGRRGNFWGDPGKGAPGTSMGRAAMDALERSIERQARRVGRDECVEGLAAYEAGE